MNDAPGPKAAAAFNGPDPWQAQFLKDLGVAGHHGGLAAHGLVAWWVNAVNVRKVDVADRNHEQQTVSPARPRQKYPAARPLSRVLSVPVCR